MDAADPRTSAPVARGSLHAISHESRGGPLAPTSLLVAAGSRGIVPGMDRRTALLGPGAAAAGFALCGPRHARGGPPVPTPPSPACRVRYRHTVRNKAAAPLKDVRIYPPRPGSDDYQQVSGFTVVRAGEPATYGNRTDRFGQKIALGRSYLGANSRTGRTSRRRWFEWSTLDAEGPAVSRTEELSP